MDRKNRIALRSCRGEPCNIAASFDGPGKFENSQRDERFAITTAFRPEK
jgi:hypothetical protein